MREPIKRFNTESRNFYARQVMAYMRDLEDIKEEDQLPNPPKRKSQDPLDCCLQDYFHIYPLNYLTRMSDYENRAITLNILSDDKKKQLFVIPHQGLGVIDLDGEKPPAKAVIKSISVLNAVKEFNITSQEIADEIDRAIHVVCIQKQNRFKEKNPGHNWRMDGGDSFWPIVENTSA